MSKRIKDALWLRIAELEAEKAELQQEHTYHANLHLLAVERTGWRRIMFGRWRYKSEPFRRDIQRKCARNGITYSLKPWERIYDPNDV